MLAAATSAKAREPTLVTYTVQKGEALWDVAVQHGVSMRTIQELNKLPGKEPPVTEGQQLLVPASGISQVAAADAPAPNADSALANLPARGIWGERTLTDPTCPRPPASRVCMVVTHIAQADTIAAYPCMMTMHGVCMLSCAVGSEYVRLGSVADARKLYQQQCERGNSSNVLLVLYAPWCPHCRELEDEVGARRCAAVASHVRCQHNRGLVRPWLRRDA